MQTPSSVLQVVAVPIAVVRQPIEQAGKYCWRVTAATRLAAARIERRDFMTLSGWGASVHLLSRQMSMCLYGKRLAYPPM